MDNQVEVFTQFRPVFYIVLGVLVVFLILSLLPKGRDSKINLYSTLMISISHLAISSTLLVVESRIVDAYSFRGDSITFYCFIATVVLSVLNPIVFYFRNKGKRRSRSSYSYR